MARAQQIIEAITRDLWTVGRLDVVDELFRVDFVDHAPVAGFGEDREGLRSFVQAVHRECTEVVMTNELLVANGDWIAHRWRLRAHDTDAFLDDPLHGGEWDIHGNDILRLRGDRIAERWSEADTAAFAERLGTVS